MPHRLALLPLLLLAASGVQAQQVYRCPGPPVLYTDALSAKEAQEKGCRSIEGTPITILQSPKPRPAASGATAGAPVQRTGNDGRVEPAQQKVRDDERRRVLEGELREGEQRLAELQREYQGGQPERRGDERNFQKYLDRVAELKASITRQEADIQALKREISKLP
ncbi:coiled-coil domain-containing protein 22 [Roseateles sp. DAIF2]|uniref:hypothetical protein n=1 Tax=Roseateles sp. DAIF2 TaxID=2714952 RepID=UPI0018A2EFA1|nr:hypothetical protein [Roseateles sp. DAIF2]QPF72875.1 coiled-coil domain-containing protein 22 [Roseateles sp. DAIF2]